MRRQCETDIKDNSDESDDVETMRLLLLVTRSGIQGLSYADMIHQN